MIDPKSLEQVTEIVKSINIAFDGKLNSDTLFQIVKEATPQVVQYLYFLQIKDIAINLFWCIGVVVSAYLVGKQVAKMREE